MNTQQVDFASLYFGTPVAIISSQNPDSSTNLSPISSWWILDKHIVFGLGTSGKCYENICKNPDMVLNIPDSKLWQNVEFIADKSGKAPLPELKKMMGYTFEKDKFSCGKFNKEKATTVSSLRIKECPVQIEAHVVGYTPLVGTAGELVSVDACISAIHIAEELLIATGTDIRFDVDRWKPLYYIFRHYFSIGTKLGHNFRCDN
ncbi:flavin reductase family protein [Enterobacter asburiae]|nr:flavin reductase family protein [Enterobacter asburiae]EKI0255343.1 flavin reductase family protein [Enterobacter asburiae]